MLKVKKIIIRVYVFLITLFLSTELQAQTRKKVYKEKKPGTAELTIDVSKIVMDRDIFDPDTLRYGFHAQKTGLSIDTGSNLELYYKIYDWLGVPYRFGGSSRKGIDCSAFTNVIYREVFDKYIPRDSRSIYSVVQTIDRSDLKEGDLLFFKIRRGQVSHIGVYLCDEKFVHASTTRGVIISNLNEDYYRRYFYKAGRLKSIETLIDEAQ